MLSEDTALFSLKSFSLLFCPQGRPITLSVALQPASPLLLPIQPVFHLILLYCPHRLRLNVLPTCSLTHLSPPTWAGWQSISIAAICGPVPRTALVLSQHLWLLNEQMPDRKELWARDATRSRRGQEPETRTRTDACWLTLFPLCPFPRLVSASPSTFRCICLCFLHSRFRAKNSASLPFP